MSSKPSKSRESKPPTEAGEEKRSAANPAGEEEIKRRAYEIYLERGEQHGRDVEDWLQAERELASHEVTPQEE